ncbi:MAG: ribosome recycling factor [Candidatus Moranbacteria bacterium]|nr:ribosome recycling factor [Candidatus Moranbacteria bacterium]
MLQNLKQELLKLVDSFKKELSAIRAGRASSGLVENLKVEYFGNPTPLIQLSQVTIPDPKTIMITPWNKGDIEKIEKAIQDSDLNLNPSNNGESVILNLPPMTQERREELNKMVGQKAEEYKIKIRKKREEIINEISEKKNQSEISEDEFFTQKEKIQDLIDEMVEKIDQVRKSKEDEIAPH